LLRDEYTASKGQDRDKEEIQMKDTTQIFQDLINDVREEETRFLKAIKYPIDRQGQDW
jgi:hypothetical protein